MAKERLKSPRARLFVALDLPEAVREGLAAWQREWPAGERTLRPARAETLHMTLAFLGYHPERDLKRIAAAATELEATAPLMRFLEQPVAVPRNRPRLFAVDAESPEAVTLQAEVSESLEAAGFYEPEKRPFWPHLTVARVRTERGTSAARGRRSGRPMRVSSPPGPLPEALLEPFRAVRVTLYRSLLRPAGAEYVSVAQLELPSPGGGKVS